LRSDGAQVTRPSIDPYREDIDTSFYLAQGKLYLSLPIILDVSEADKETKEALSWASLALSSAVFSIETDPKYAEVTISADGNGFLTWGKSYKPFTYLYLPSSSDILDDVSDYKGVYGFIIDEDSGNEDIEVVISEVDTKLKSMGVRRRFDVIAKSSRIRDSGDAFKLVALGADSVIMSHKVLEVAIGEGSKGSLKDKAFNLISGFKKEIALLAGAAGVYSVQSTLTGNRELLRAVNLNSYVLKKLRVKAAGSL